MGIVMVENKGKHKENTKKKEEQKIGNKILEKKRKKHCIMTNRGVQTFTCAYSGWFELPNTTCYI